MLSYRLLVLFGNAVISDAISYSVVGVINRVLLLFVIFWMYALMEFDGNCGIWNLFSVIFAYCGEVFAQGVCY